MAKHRAPRTHRIELAGIAAAITIPTALVVSAFTATTPTELGAGTDTVHHSAAAADHGITRVADENDPRWVCWLDGNGLCSTVPLAGH